MDPQDRLLLARDQLAKVQVSWLDPPDWSDLTIYGLHTCENAVVAAAEHIGLTVKKTHWDKASIAEKLHRDHGLPDISGLLGELNELRKGFAYGELTIDPSMAPEEIAVLVERYVETVDSLLKREGT